MFGEGEGYVRFLDRFFPRYEDQDVPRSPRTDGRSGHRMIFGRDNGQTGSIDALLAPFVGAELRGVGREFFEFGDEVDRDEGPLHLRLGNEDLRFRSGADGQTLTVTVGRWVDPWAKMDDVLAKSVAEFGKWTFFDVSVDPLVQEFIGSRFLGVTDHRPSTVGTIEATLVFEAGHINLNADGDELTVGFVPVPRRRPWSRA